MAAPETTISLKIEENPQLTSCTPKLHSQTRKLIYHFLAINQKNVHPSGFSELSKFFRQV
jgi:hypothetical protein